MEHYSGQTEIRATEASSWPATQRCEGEVEHYSGQTESVRVRAKWNTTPVKLRSEVSYTEA